MSKAIFLGESFYTWLGMRDILRGTTLFVDMEFHSSQTLSTGKEISQNADYLIINPSESEALKYAGIIRAMSLRPSATIIVLADENTFSLFQTVCGMRLEFLDDRGSLDAILQKITSIINGKKPCAPKPLANPMTVNEFNVMMLFARGWSLSQIAGASHKSEKTISAYKSNIAKKLGHNNTRLKYMISQYSQL